MAATTDRAAALLVPHHWVRLRDLLRELVARDIKLRYRGSVLGILWTLLNPLAELLVLLFVFGVVLQVTIPNFSAYLFTGLIVYGWFQTSVNFATGAVVSNRELVRRPGVPVVILPIVTVASNLVHFLLSLPVLFGLLIANHVAPTTAVLALPLLIALEFVLILGFAYPVAIIHVWFRDTQHVLRIALQLLFYLTPIFYETSSVPKSLLWFYRINPLAHLVDAYRAVLMRGELPPAGSLLYLTAASAVLLVAGVGVVQASELSLRGRALMIPPIRVAGLGKTFRRFHPDRPATIQEAVAKGVHGIRRLRSVERFWALKDVSFDVDAGRTVGLIGANGSGKSTLLRLIGKIGRPDTGTIEVRGRLGALLDLAAGFHADLTGRENAVLSGILNGLTRKQLLDRMDAIVDFAEVEDALDSPMRTFSSGMQMRLAFAVAVHTNPDILLIDEVLSVGDLAFQRKCLKRIDEFKARGCSILYVSHEVETVGEFCDEAIWLHSGKLMAQGAAKDVVRQYTEFMRGVSESGHPA